jgi:hypothetical protein
MGQLRIAKFCASFALAARINTNAQDAETDLICVVAKQGVRFS